MSCTEVAASFPSLSYTDREPCGLDVFETLWGGARDVQGGGDDEVVLSGKKHGDIP